MNMELFGDVKGIKIADIRKEWNMLRFQTITGTITSVMPRVYFCSDPYDFNLYFRTICSDVFALQENCAIFYEEDPAAEYEECELFALLAEMRLIVVPITKKFLSGHSRAIEKELPFAKSKHIPILPILVEEDDTSHLIDAFNQAEVFSGTQFLNKFEKDRTAIRYTEKLKRYLKSVLVSEEETRRIHDEFSSNIFLSYRKKDRAHAQELMREIHKVDICRDTAIWYDEYLVPGESFDTNIMTALEESDVFVMSVTSSFEEPGNYVAVHEYPDAVRKNKPLVAVEMKQFDETSLRKLESLYPGIKAILIDPSDQDAFGVSLKQRLIMDAGISEAKLLDDNGEHLYYMALAYSNGVRTEIDSERAAGLFRLSATNGCYESYLRLIRMHRIGDGIQRDLYAALSCCNQALSVLQPISGETVRTDHVLASVYEEAGHIYAHLRKTEETETAYRNAYELRRQMKTQYPDASQEEYQESMIALASVYCCAGRPKEAETITLNYSVENHIFSEDNADDINILHAKSRICGLLINIYMQLKLHSEMRKYEALNVEISERILSKSGELRDLKVLADAYINYAELLKLYDPQKSCEFMDKYREIEKKIPHWQDDRKTIHDAINTFRLAENRLLGLRSNDPNAVESAKALYLESLEICNSLLEGGDRYSALILTSHIKERLGEFGTLERQSRRYVIELYDQALSILLKMEKEFRNDLLVKQLISSVLDSIGTEYLDAGDLTTASKYYTDALEIDLRSSKLTGEPTSRHHLAKSYMRCAEINIERGHQPAANVNYKSAVKLLEALVDETDDYRILEDLALSYFKLGIADKLTNEQRLEYSRKAAERYEQLMKMTNNAEEYVSAYASAQELIALLQL